MEEGKDEGSVQPQASVVVSEGDVKAINGGDDSSVVFAGEVKRKAKSKYRSPLMKYVEYRTKKKEEYERVMLLRDERMVEDLERYLMEIEEERSWIVLQLNHLNYQRIRKTEIINRIRKAERTKEERDEEENMKENGLFFFQGNVQSYRRWQNSPAKFKDFLGHKSSVTSCKFSMCLKYILSCSDDNTMKLWTVDNAECIKTYIGHTKVVNDSAFHPTLFKLHSQACSIISCSGDGTIRFWNTSINAPVVTIFGHQNAVYRCSFSPDGNTVISCSEDKTIRTWNFPEGYNLFTYRGHQAPVISVKYSYSGKYFVSGSDYGERKILLWDAKLPHFSEPSKFPHIIFWTPEGLIRKLLIKQANPRPTFWLAQHQLTWITSDNDMDIWKGENSDDEFMDDNEEAEDHDEEDPDATDESSTEEDNKNEKTAKRLKKKRLLVAADDIRESEGVLIDVISLASEEVERDSAFEYHPDGSLVVHIRSINFPIKEGFLTAVKKDTRWDMYSPMSGTKAGKFALDAPIPWLPMLYKVDTLGKRYSYRDPPIGLTTSTDECSVIYNDTRFSHNRDAKDDDSEVSVKNDFEIVWQCPPPYVGDVVIVFNFRIEESEKWYQVRYSLIESSIRSVGSIRKR